MTTKAGQIPFRVCNYEFKTACSIGSSRSFYPGTGGGDEVSLPPRFRLYVPCVLIIRKSLAQATPSSTKVGNAALSERRSCKRRTAGLPQKHLPDLGLDSS